MHTLSAHEIHHRFLRGELKAEKLIQSSLERILKLDTQVGAFLSLFKERALEKARAVDQKRAATVIAGKTWRTPTSGHRVRRSLHRESDDPGEYRRRFALCARAHRQRDACVLWGQ